MLGLILTFSSIPIKSVSQSIRPIVRSLAVEDGLAHNFVYRIYQDDYGGIWIATANGLNYYDGREITSFTHDPDDENSLTQNDIGDIKSAPNGDLWMAMHKSVDRYDRRTESFEHYALDSGGHIIYPDSIGGIWVGTTGGIRYKAPDTNKFTSYPFKPHPLDKNLESSVVRFIHLAEDGYLYFATKHGLYAIHSRSQEENGYYLVLSFPVKNQNFFM